ncbi:unnamed protein product, partial [Closterium sp. NIES-54]
QPPHRLLLLHTLSKPAVLQSVVSLHLVLPPLFALVVASSSASSSCPWHTCYGTSSSLPTVPDPESDCARAASPSVSRLLATAVTDPSFESTAAFALVVELVDLAAACRLDYATALVGESESANPP